MDNNLPNISLAVSIVILVLNLAMLAIKIAIN